MCVTTSPFVPAHVGHDGVPEIAIDPADAAAKPNACRAVVDDTAVVPAEPGSAVWSCTYKVAGAVNVTPLPAPRITFSHAFARFTALSPTVIAAPLRVPL